MIRNLLFDLDGTLTDPKDGIVRSINYALAKFGMPECEASVIERYIGPPLKDTLAALMDTDEEETLMQAVRWYRERYITQGYMENYVYDGIPELLRTCTEAGYRLYVATSKRQDIACSVLDHFELKGFFAKVYGCDVDLSKTDLLATLLREQSLKPSDCLMIGDRRHDVEAARPNGIPAAGVLWGYGSLEELTKAAPEFIAPTPSDLLKGVMALGYSVSP